MNCQVCQELLQRRLDGEVVEGASLDRHLDECAECRSLHAAGRSFAAALTRLTPPRPPLHLSTRIAERVLADRRSRRRRRLLTTMALAASLLLAFGVAVFWPLPKQPNDLVQHEPPAPPAATMDLRESVVQAGSAVVALTTRTTDEAVDPARELLPVLANPMLGEIDLQPVVEMPTVALSDAGQGLKSGLEPVTSSARRAVGLFLRDLSPGEPDAKPGL